jgi:hypothetical protein
MAALSHGDSTHGVTSSDDATVLPFRAGGRRLRLPVLGRPIALAVDEAVPSEHRTRRARRSGAAHVTPPQSAEERMGFIASTALAMVSLVFVTAVALGSLLASTAVLHLAYPDRHFDDFRALHEPLVLGLLLGLAVFWLLPPHPWAVEPVQSEPKKRRLFRAEAGA